MDKHLKRKLGDDLYQACRAGRVEDISSLEERFRRENPAYTLPLSAMMTVAAETDQANMVSYCLEQGGAVTDAVMTTLISANSFETHRLLVASKAVDINRFVPWFGDILGVVAPEGNYEWTRFCLENGADPNLNKVDGFKSVLAAAAERSTTEMVALLIEHGAQLNGSGALILAAEAGRKEMAEFLLDRGADIDEMGFEDPTDEREVEDMGTPIHKAIINGHRDVVELLIGRGANIELKDAKGRTPLSLVRESGHPELGRLLQSSDA
ncbi:hypothetical protein FQN50_007430 [Emmonsiellopsis sp. PD_5]|nr:hypothetical protein FQN50_007430 [Emmonsiellopsis sp. PD_5]